MHHVKYLLISTFSLVCLPACNQLEFASKKTPFLSQLAGQSTQNPSFKIDPKFRNQKLLLDLDGDGSLDLVRVVKNTLNQKAGLEVIFGNHQRVEYLMAGEKLDGLI